MKIILGISGADGTLFTKNIIEKLEMAHELFVLESENGGEYFKKECGTELYDFLRNKSTVTYYSNDNVFAPQKAKFETFDGMVVVPCSASTIGKLANGCGGSLMHVAADIMLRNKKKLILGITETPLSTITLNNLGVLSNSGAIIMPFTTNVNPHFDQETITSHFKNS